MLRATPDFKSRIYSTGLKMKDLADRAGVNRSTLFSWVNTKQKRSIRLNLAWDVARAYANIEGISKEEAFARLFIEVEEAPA